MDKSYLLKTWHPDKAPVADVFELSGEVEWLGLEIIDTRRGRAADNLGEVEFIARFRQPDGEGRLHERSRFKRMNGAWFYLDAMSTSVPDPSSKTGRNKPCPCGSGKKYKRCCG